MDIANKPVIIDNTLSKVENPDRVPFEDGGQVTLSCSNCDKPLVVVWRTRPNEKLKNQPVNWKLKAKCCYCGDNSFTKKIVGGFHYKGYDTPHANGNPEDVVPHVNVVDVKTDEEFVVFITKKA